jgi:hypothetical protein
MDAAQFGSPEPKMRSMSVICSSTTRPLLAEVTARDRYQAGARYTRHSFATLDIDREN